MKGFLILLAIFITGTTTANGDSSTLDAAIGGGIGGAAGAAIGNEVGGREGAISGSALGAAVGTTLNTGSEPPRGSSLGNYRYQNDAPQRGHPHYGFCPPGQAIVPIRIPE